MLSGARPIVSGRRGGHMNTMIRGGLGVLLATALISPLTSLVVATPAFAQSQLHQITWAHAEPETVSHFVILVSETEGQVEGAREENVGKPQGDAVGRYTLFSAMIAFDPTEFLAVSAVGFDGQRSMPSDWGAVAPTRPGQPLLVD